METKLNFLAVIGINAIVLGFWSSAHPALLAVGPTDPINGFPQGYQDTNGVQLQLCLDPINCVPDRPIAAMLSHKRLALELGHSGEARTVS